MIKYSSRERCVSLSHIVDTLFLSNFRLALIITSVATVFTILMMFLDHLILSEPFFSNSNLHSSFYASLSGVIGMLLAFRTSQAYGRFWDATNLTFELFGDLFLSVSNLIAFCLYSQASRKEITTFQQTLVRLVSLLSAMMLTELEGYDTLNDAPYEVIELESFELHSMSTLMTEKDKTEIVFQWIKNLMVESITGGVLTIPPPILTRVFQELDAAMSKYHQAEKFSKVPFPFPYVAALELFMVIHTLLTPLTLVNIIPNLVWPPLLTFVFVFMLWSLHFACSELENPYMGDANDLDLQDMQCILNDRLASITITRNQVVPRLVNLEGAIAWLCRTRTEKLEEAKFEAQRKRRMSVSRMEDVNDTVSLESPHTSEEIVQDSTIGTEVSFGSGSNMPSNSNGPGSSTTNLRSEVGHSRETAPIAGSSAQSSQDSPVAAHDVHIGCAATAVCPSRTSHPMAENNLPVMPHWRRRSMRRSTDQNTVGSFFRASLHGRESMLSQAMTSSVDEESYMNDSV